MKLKSLAEVHGICVGGVEYANDADGCINLPDQYVSVALEAGYTLPADETAEPTPETVKE